jgi:hypothetical protein
MITIGVCDELLSECAQDLVDIDVSGVVHFQPP